MVLLLQTAALCRGAQIPLVLVDQPSENMVFPTGKVSQQAGSYSPVEDAAACARLRVRGCVCRAACRPPSRPAAVPPAVIGW